MKRGSVFNSNNHDDHEDDDDYEDDDYHDHDDRIIPYANNSHSASIHSYNL